jgi:predicted ATP-grasp superfamily ATP-dependent carboligase
MEWWYSIIIGVVAFVYIQSFNRNTKMYLESGKTLSWREFFAKVIPDN